MKKITFPYLLKIKFLAKKTCSKKRLNYFTCLPVLFFTLFFNHSIHASLLKDNFVKVGEGTMSWMFLDIYHASLFTSTGEYRQRNYPQMLTINYLKNINKDNLIEATEEQWLIQNVDEKKLQPWLQQLQQIWPDIKKGDSLTFYVADNKKGYFYHNQSLLGSVNSEDFCNAFLDIWLSEKTSQPQLRRQLLALK